MSERKSTAAEAPDIVRVAVEDDVAVALRDLEPAYTVATGDDILVLRQFIPAGHKLALRPIALGHPVRRYGEPIGLATCEILPGDHVHSHNLRTALSGELDYMYQPNKSAVRRRPPTERHFMGYRRPGGTVGTRNEIWIIPTVGCVGRLAERLSAAASAETIRGIDGVHAFNHPYGCSQLGADLEATSALLAALAQNPNAAGVLLIGLGCESNQLDALLEQIPLDRRARVRTLHAQDASNEFDAGLAELDALIALARGDRREPVPLSALRIGVKCGGSDGMSGLTANPVIGRVADAVTAAGGSALLTEIPEIFGAEHLLMARADSQATFDRLVEVVNRFKRYFIDHGEPVSENPSPGNVAGGITTLEEKSLGAVQKGGASTLTDVIDYAGQLRRSGLTLLEAPGNDAVSTTALAAAGATLTLFSTGRGTPLGSPVPTLKIASNRALAARKPAWIDFDASRSLEIGISAAAEKLLDLVVRTASGEVARNEVNQERSIGIWKRGVTL